MDQVMLTSESHFLKNFHFRGSYKFSLHLRLHPLKTSFDQSNITIGLPLDIDCLFTGCIIYHCLFTGCIIY